ncbi:thermostable hemolysin [Variovorax sp. JS1663]|uniref:thermostable hemolysin n=1 Tax=Variovorax sp. JS1663 TaxID=1851577 RepID=UPI000B343808|nr:thermostable hemolysin [Variovorax sp. JS1663]OUM00977.1 hypothetical protein A8M77_18520 [Variovorax sp. JS1663]
MHPSLTTSFDPRPPSSPRGRQPGAFAIHVADDPGRHEVEDFICRVYANRYGAQIVEFAPVLVSLRDPAGTMVAAAGYRAAAQAPLFLERYLEAPIETILGGHVDEHPSRDCIVEVGHLAATRAGEGRRLIHFLGAHLAAQGFQWVVGTLTRELRHLFLRIGVTPVELGRADPGVLGEQAASWGSYYEHGPAVLAGHLPQAIRRLTRETRRAELDR